jgi:hypothetical protein
MGPAVKLAKKRLSFLELVEQGVELTCLIFKNS